MDSKFKTWGFWWEEWISPFLIALILALLIRTFLFQPFKIPSTSMYPTLKVGDRIFVNRFLYGAKVPFLNKELPKVRDPKRGDIIVFVSATDPIDPQPIEQYKKLLGPIYWDKDRNFFKWYTRRYLVKRLIGLPKDKVEIKNSKVYINDQVLDEKRVSKFSYYNNGKYSNENQIITVPENSYFVLGDNSGNSVDSRFWGFVPDENLVGKVVMIWWPVTRVRVVK